MTRYKIAVVLFVLVAIGGCGKRKPEPAWEAQLRTRAAEQHLNWQVFCLHGYFYGVAWPYGTKLNGYIEEGGEGEFVARGDTQEEAAEELYRVMPIKDGPDWFSPLDEPRSLRICPPEISGGEDQP